MKNNIFALSKWLPKGIAGLILAFGVSSCMGPGESNTNNQNEEPRPNIIFLLTDDQRSDALGAMGNSIIETPNLDRLANDGVLFENAFVTTSICVASRASILSGQYTSRHGINSFHHSFDSSAIQKTYPLLLKNQADYNIGFIGKYGVGLDFPDEHFDYWAVEKKHQPDYENYDENGNFIHHNDMVDNQIQEFIEKFGDSDGPFCLSVSFKAPHAQDGDDRQFIPQERFMDLYSDVEIPLPETYDSTFYYNKFPEDFRFPPKAEGKLNEARRRWNLRFPNPEKYQETVRNYYRLISGVDEVAGNMMDKLKEMNLDENTIIVFMGDNGFYLGEHGLAGKWYGHQESVRVPLFIYDPRYSDEVRGERIKEMVLNIDVAPTILSMGNVDTPNQMQGKDLLPLIEGEPKSWRTEFYYEHTLDIPTIPKSIGVISEDYTYLRYPELESEFEEFYDLSSDSLQINNLIGEEEYSDLIEDYRDRTDEWKRMVK